MKNEKVIAPCPFVEAEGNPLLAQEFLEPWWKFIHTLKFNHWYNAVDLCREAYITGIDKTLWASGRCEVVLMAYLETYDYWMETKMKDSSQFFRIIEERPFNDVERS